ncbi:MAG: ATP-dependent RNA helicase HrpA, partial [Leifsonia flava]
GRTFPVEIRYRPLVAETEGDDEDDDGAARDDKDYLQGIIDALDELARESTGDVLVFLSGENEIRDAEEAVRGHYQGGASVTEVLPLYGRLSSADQHRVFEPSKTAGVRRRIVLATNVAETSLTVPGIRYVVDAGTARISRYSVRSKVQRLPIEAISQASANQRSGRSGRTSDGIAIRLYSEEDFTRRPEFTEPEVLRTNLAAVILQMISLGLGSIEDFPFLTPPDSRGIKDGLDLLKELGAVEKGASLRLTRIGRDLARLPIDPRFGRMVIESKTQAVSREVLAIVAGITIQDPRERPLEKRPQADQLHARFADPTSDFLTLLNLWNHIEKQQKELSSSAFRRLCKSEFLNYLRVREWQDVYRQLRQLAKPLGLTVNDRELAGDSPDADGIHKALLSGLLSHIGLKDEKPAKGAGGRPRIEYIGARQARFAIFPGSSLAKKQPDAVMSAELVETSRLFGRMNAAIDPAWAEPLAGDLLTRSHSEPHWEKTQGAVVAYEKVTLYGVPIIPRRRVQFARIDQPYARELFIRHALVQGEWDSKQAFDRANRKLRTELEQLEERTRRRDILFDDEAVFEFYEKRIPADVYSTRSFEGWWRRARNDTPDLLTMTPEALAPEDAPEVDETAYPPSWRQDDQRFTLRYRFEPGAVDDGVTAVIPLALLARVSPNGFDWQVAGLRTELIAAIIKALPKAIRRQVVPANDWAVKIAAELPDEPADEPFTAAVAAIIQRLTYTAVTAADVELDRIPGHLRVTFSIVDDRGRPVASGKDLRALQLQLADKARDAVARTFAEKQPRQRAGGPTQVAAARDALTGTRLRPTGAFSERTGITTWDLDEIPRHVDTRVAGNSIRAYPALVDDGASVSLRLLPTAEDQAAAMPGGIRRLLALAVPSPSSYVQQHLTNTEKLALAASPYRSTTALFDDCLLACIDDVLYRIAPDGMLFQRSEFEAVRDRVSGVIMESMFETVGLVSRTLSAARSVDKALKEATSMQVISALTDARGQVGGLVYPGFVSATGLERLRHVPRYLNGILARVVKLRENPARDRVWMTEVQNATARYEEAGGTIPIDARATPSLVKARWMIEELRISLFAQELRAAETVSLQRIVKVLSGR